MLSRQSALPDPSPLLAQPGNLPKAAPACLCGAAVRDRLVDLYAERVGNAQNKTPGADRIFWCYGPEKGEMTIIAITPHP